jgi:hypothetical protein
MIVRILDLHQNAWDRLICLIGNVISNLGKHVKESCMWIIARCYSTTPSPIAWGLSNDYIAIHRINSNIFTLQFHHGKLDIYQTEIDFSVHPECAPIAHQWNECVSNSTGSTYPRYGAHLRTRGNFRIGRIWCYDNSHNCSKFVSGVPVMTTIKGAWELSLCNADCWYPVVVIVCKQRSCLIRYSKKWTLRIFLIKPLWLSYQLWGTLRLTDAKRLNLLKATNAQAADVKWIRTSKKSFRSMY